jgi:hypothetical protein
VEAGVDGPDQFVGDEADDEQADHDEEGHAVEVGAALARLLLAVGDPVDDQRAEDTGGGPGGEQPAVDGLMKNIIFLCFMSTKYNN